MASRKYSVFLTDGTVIQHAREDQALAFFEATPTAQYAAAGNGKVIAGVNPDATDAPNDPETEAEPTLTFSDVGERGGRFYRETWGAEGATSYQKNPRSVLRRALGCTWKELGELGLDSNKVANATLDALEAGTLSIEDLFEQVEELRDAG